MAESSIAVDALVVNRVHPTFDADASSAGSDATRATELEGTPLGTLYANLVDFRLVAHREGEHLAGLGAKVAPAPVVLVPFLPTDVHDLEGLDEIGKHLFPAAATGREI